MKILVTGAAGQLGREIVLALQDRKNKVVAIDRPELDFAQPDKVSEGIAQERADWVINCAAYTQVDQAEQEPDLAYLINRDSALAVAEGVKSYGARLLHISTDFIFDGHQATPYSENDQANPLSVYGRSKWEGERAVLQAMPEAVVLRTAWVFGVHGNNFVKTMLRLAAERDQLGVVDDQVGTPSWTWDIACAVRALMLADTSGVYNFTNEGVASWYDFACEIIDSARRFGRPVKTKMVKPIPTSDYPTPAVRPAYSVLSKRKIRGLLDYDIPHWRRSLHAMLVQNFR